MNNSHLKGARGFGVYVDEVVIVHRYFPHWKKENRPFFKRYMPLFKRKWCIVVESEQMQNDYWGKLHRTSPKRRTISYDLSYYKLVKNNSLKDQPLPWD
ncbi:MAG: hypothetical protein EOM67_13875 [Spirochaetia bacterium]|nr:hypothetical protein [Spirochaetia bacterium]